MASMHLLLLTSYSHPPHTLEEVRAFLVKLYLQLTHLISTEPMVSRTLALPPKGEQSRAPALEECTMQYH